MDEERRNRLILYGVAAAGILGLAIALIVIFAVGRGGGGSTAHFDGPNVEFRGLPGVINRPPPWPANRKDLRERLQPVGLTPLPTEGNVLHIHQHLDIYVNGKHITVPEGIGIKFRPDKNLDFITELHTHDTDGVIHLESPNAVAYSLGQFFGVWGVRLASNCVGGLCSPPNPLAVYVNGKKIGPADDPVKLVLQQHDEIAIVYGKPPAKIPSSYAWQPGE